MFRNLCTIWFTMVVLCIGSSLAFAATFRVVSSGNGVYTVQGSEMDGIGGVDLMVSYDKSSLSSPVTSQGSLAGAVFAANDKFAPGLIKIAIISTSGLSGSGTLAVIKFGNRGSGTVSITSANPISTGGAPVAGTIEKDSISQPPPTDSGGSTDKGQTDPSTQGSQQAAAAGTSAPTGMGTVTMPGDIQPSSDAKPAETTATEPPQQTPPVAESLAAAAEPSVIEKPVEPAANVEVKQTVYGSVLERFRTYQGEKTPATMTALFAKEVAPTIRQEPAIAISDGKTNVRIIADMPASAGSSPNFALSGASMVTLKKGDVSGRWILEALPNKNTMTASVTILSGSSVIEYPLTTVSSVVKVSAEESYFADFLKDAGTKAPKKDLNADGRHDYLDDYIYTALYQIQKGSGKAPKK